mmetsp:Transcript_21826/g.75005  ORF Transcript_21826/g.75005 Transcript_21826/m.75005 type:complete len:466 (-) Transcript_21826:16-1413(-)
MLTFGRESAVRASLCRRLLLFRIVLVVLGVVCAGLLCAGRLRDDHPSNRRLVVVGELGRQRAREREEVGADAERRADGAERDDADEDGTRRAHVRSRRLRVEDRQHDGGGNVEDDRVARSETREARRAGVARERREAEEDDEAAEGHGVVDLDDLARDVDERRKRIHTAGGDGVGGGRESVERRHAILDEGKRRGVERRQRVRQARGDARRARREVRGALEGIEALLRQLLEARLGVLGGRRRGAQRALRRPDALEPPADRLDGLQLRALQDAVVVRVERREDLLDESVLQEERVALGGTRVVDVVDEQLLQRGGELREGDDAVAVGVGEGEELVEPRGLRRRRVVGDLELHGRRLGAQRGRRLEDGRVRLDFLVIRGRAQPVPLGQPRRAGGPPRWPRDGARRRQEQRRRARREAERRCEQEDGGYPHGVRRHARRTVRYSERVRARLGWSNGQLLFLESEILT